MAIQKLFLSLLVVFVAAATTAQQAKAVTVTAANLGALSGPVTVTGTLANQATVLEESFSITAPAHLTIFTDSYGGGSNVNGSTAAAGGFMPSLVLFNSTGNFVAAQTFPSPIGNKDPKTGLDGDSYISTGTLSAGAYTIALSDFLLQQPPTANNLSAGFIDYGSGTTFTDVQGNLRNGNYSLNISGVSSAATPEPGTFSLLLLPAVAVAAGLRLRKRTARG